MEHMEYRVARERIVSMTAPLGTEFLPLEQSCGRILAQTVAAQESVPPFDRSAYDGYALRACDIAQATREKPVTLQILEEVPAGHCPTKCVIAGTATKILTGAPIPAGADAVVAFERTEFTAETLRVFSPLPSGSNIVKTGEDMCRGEKLASAGTRIDAGLAGTLAAQGIVRVPVYCVPHIGLICTGTEVMEREGPLTAGKIRNSNRPMLEAALQNAGCTSEYLGTVGDSAEEIAALLERGLRCCDALILTGGVSVGDYDLTPAAMELAGARVLFRGVAMKPGMACAYGIKDGKWICALSGNPAAALTNFYALTLPCLQKLRGETAKMQEITATLAEPFLKKSKLTRLLRGTLDLTDGTVRVHISQAQGNSVLHSAIGCNVMVEIPAGSDALPAGTKLKGILLP